MKKASYTRRCSSHVVAPFLGATALALLSGWDIVAYRDFEKENHHAPTDTKGWVHAENHSLELGDDDPGQVRVKRAGFGSTFAAFVIAAGIATILIRSGEAGG